VSSEAQERSILTLSCPDRTGIVATVTGYLFERGCFLIDSNHFGDETTGTFFSRAAFTLPEGVSQDDVERGFAPIAERFIMNARFSHAERKTRTLIMVSKLEHCLNELLHRMRIGALGIDVPLVISNHESLRGFVEWHGIRYEHLPVTGFNKEEQEARMLDLIDEYDIELVILARYMQVFSPEFCRKMDGRIINIHHSFLPSFRGARPYAQAYARGVKVIGATAHYVTEVLDEGPIIEQVVERVDHDYNVDDLTNVGRDAERIALARAVSAHVEHRVLRNGDKTVVFP
jgi:formyltetrahydrofolate deformylase